MISLIACMFVLSLFALISFLLFKGTVDEKGLIVEEHTSRLVAFGCLASVLFSVALFFLHVILAG